MAQKRYENLDQINTIRSAKELLRWRKERRGKTKDLSFVVPHDEDIDIAFLQNNRTEMTITWIGHSTFLLQMNGLNILTDPVWANRMGFDKRLSRPGIPIMDLPPIDLVLISHGHYDHLDFYTLRRISGEPQFFVPDGLLGLMKRKDYKKVREFSWWDSFTIQNLTFTFVPAQHWTRRTLWDTNTSHWGGWIIEQKGGKTIYFAGDSGYFRGFKEIGKRFSIDYALMPIGAYEPEWFMSPQHVNPEEAVRAFLDVKAKCFIPMHYGAFRLADDTPKEALERVKSEWERLRLPNEQLNILKLGEIFRPDLSHKNT
ncbi:MBL fold metallo-hydrolase [Fictibacillus sp. Mic-4]|uniref:MBL fold metallo-hydrolase n=1 Tax=Fictibacillus sp. Mic-4 TaxID=3132826 RepID=UPI003CEED42C